MKTKHNPYYGFGCLQKNFSELLNHLREYSEYLATIFSLISLNFRIKCKVQRTSERSSDSQLERKNESKKKFYFIRSSFPNKKSFFYILGSDFEFIYKKKSLIGSKLRFHFLFFSSTFLSKNCVLQHPNDGTVYPRIISKRIKTRPFSLR